MGLKTRPMQSSLRSLMFQSVIACFLLSAGLCDSTTNTTYTETGRTTDDSIYTTLSQMSIASTAVTSIATYSTEMATSLASEEHSTSKPVVATSPTGNTTNSIEKETTLSETTSADTSTTSTWKTELSVPTLNTASTMTPSAATNITDTAPSINLSTVSSSSNSTDIVTGSELTSAPTATDVHPSTIDVTSSITEITKETPNPSEPSSTVDTKETTVHQIASEATKSPFTISTSQTLTSKKVTATSEATTDVGIKEPRSLTSGSVAAITVIVILVVLMVFGGAAFWKIRHSSYGRLLEDQDYGSLGNYNNPLYDDS